MSAEDTIRKFNAAHPNAGVEMRTTGQGEPVLAISGELDMKASTDLSAVMAEFFDGVLQSQRVIVDLFGVEYISSSGVGVLISAMTNAQRRSARLVLRGVKPRVRNVLQLLGFLSYFHIEDSGE
ncbi:MAG: STAS domain-containing protein [Candidatus Competibacteraceae bacterium]|nr:STAS domain-containing protein [Candidatus Competibacteraceae bacterium]